MAWEATPEERTEAPTAKRLEEAKRRGEHADASGLLVGLGLFGFATVLALGGPVAGDLLVTGLRGDITEVLEAQGRPEEALERQILSFLGRLGLVLLPLIVLAAAIATAYCRLRGGPVLVWERFAPEASRLRPGASLEGPALRRRGTRALLSLLRLAAAATAAALVLHGLARSGGLSFAWRSGSMEGLLAASWPWFSRLGLLLAAALLGVGALELVIERRAYLARLRMSRHEAAEEAREAEGAGARRAARRRAQGAALSGPAANGGGEP